MEHLLQNGVFESEIVSENVHVRVALGKKGDELLEEANDVLARDLGGSQRQCEL